MASEAGPVFPFHRRKDVHHENARRALGAPGMAGSLSSQLECEPPTTTDSFRRRQS